MATITPTYPDTVASYPNTKQVKWAMTGADTGVGVKIPDFPDKTIHLFGTWDSATIVISGSSDSTTGSDGTWTTLVDPHGNALSKTADAIEVILENPLWIRCVSSGGTVTAVSVILTARK